MTTKSSAERRKAVRHETAMKGVLNCSHGSRLKIDIVDLSTGGFSAELGKNAVLDSTGFEVNLGGLEPLGAELRWAGRTDAGFRFQRPLHPAVFDHLVERNKPRSD